MGQRSLFITMVLPAPNGCDLACPFCAIAQRGEGVESRLTTTDYVDFVTGVAKRYRVTGLSIQGYEALLPETWETTRTVLEAAEPIIPSIRMVTNGTHLATHAAVLAKLVDVVTVSLDSADPTIHDKLRGKRGAFAATVAGIRAACTTFKRTDESVPHVTIGSVLFPGKQHFLDGMPDLLKELGVPTWEIGPYTDFRNGGSLGKSSGFAAMKQAMLDFHRRGQALGIDVAFADEFGRYQNLAELEAVMKMTPRALEADDFLIRLSPEGNCSRGAEFYGPVGESPHWNPIQEVPADFVRRIMDDIGVTLREQDQ